MSLFNYFTKVLKSNISNQNSSGNISENNKQLPEETNSNSAITETEREILECSNNAFLQNCNENNETNILNMAMGTMTKLSTADSCSKIGVSDEHSVSDLGNKIDRPKQPILESYPTQSKKWYVCYMFFVCFLSEVCLLHVCGNGWDQKHVLCMFYVCFMYVLCMFSYYWFPLTN